MTDAIGLPKKNSLFAGGQGRTPSEIAVSGVWLAGLLVYGLATGIGFGLLIVAWNAYKGTFH